MRISVFYEAHRHKKDFDRGHTMLRNEIERQILQHMSVEGIQPRGPIDFIFDGKIHRFAVEGDRGGETSGAYWAYDDGLPNWAIQDFRNGRGMIKGKLNREILSWSEREALDERLRSENPEYNRAKKAKQEREQLVQDEHIRRRAYEEYLRAEAVGAWQHAYIKLKGIERVKDFTNKIRVVTRYQAGDTCRRGDLLIPLQNCETNKFQAIERISAGLMSDGNHMKGIYSGTHRTGAAFMFSVPEPKEILICEGFATGASVREYTNGRATVICAMSCTNLMHVARAWRSKTGLRTVIVADNDKSGAGERSARAVVEAGYADTYYMPPIVGYDFNDYYNNEVKQNRS